jgi:hypothetical protein
MAAVGPNDELSWRLLDAIVACDDDYEPDKWQAIAYDSRLAEGTPITWAQMADLAEACPRVVSGTFTGFRGAAPVVQLRAVDGKYWIVWSRASRTLERVRDAFVGVESYDERKPHL